MEVLLIAYLVIGLIHYATANKQFVCDLRFAPATQLKRYA